MAGMVLWRVRVAYPPYTKRCSDCTAGARCLPALHKTLLWLYGGCALLTRPTKNDALAVRRVRITYPPYTIKMMAFS